MNVSTILERAKQELQQREWIKGLLCEGPATDPSGMCVLGAMNYAFNNNAGWAVINLDPPLAMQQARRLLVEVIREQYSDRIEDTHYYGESVEVDIAAFNNHEDTILEDVISVFEKALARSEE